MLFSYVIIVYMKHHSQTMSLREWNDYFILIRYHCVYINIILIRIILIRIIVNMRHHSHTISLLIWDIILKRNILIGYGCVYETSFSCDTIVYMKHHSHTHHCHTISLPIWNIIHIPYQCVWNSFLIQYLWV